MLKKKLYYKIGEVCEITDLKSSVLRFWEKEFSYLTPHKTSTNRRLYTSDDIENIKKIKDLLYVKGMTIEGAKKYLKASSKESDPILDGVDLNAVIENAKNKLSDIVKKLRNSE